MAREFNGQEPLRLTLAQARELLKADMLMTANERAILVILTHLEERVRRLEYDTAMRKAEGF